MNLLANSYIIILEEYGPLILKGVGLTLLLSLSGTLIGLFLALIFGSIRVQEINVYDNKFVKIIKYIGIYFVKIYVTIFRGTPMIVQAAIFFYGFYQLGITWSATAAGIFTVSINTTAYLTEVIRGAIEAVDPGQKEAARSLGMSETRAMFTIVIPQGIKNAMASIGNELVINIKDTAVLSTIMLVDLFSALKTAASDTMLYMEAYLIAAAIYLFLTYSISKLLYIIEKRIGVRTKELTSSN